MNKTAFVTGGTGFVGSHLVEELLRRECDEVRCLVRSDPKWLTDLDVTYVRGDLSDIEVVWKALDGVDLVFHLAGITRAQEWESFYETNVEATLNLMGAVKHAAPELDRVVVTSSLAAVGQCDRNVATEEAPLRPVSMYGKSKARMEKALQKQHGMSQSYFDALPLTIIRPPAVYGPRDRDVLDFFRAVKSHVCPIVGAGSSRPVSVVHARDLTSGMVDASLHSNTDSATYFLGGQRQYTWAEMKRAATEALDTWAVTIPVPKLLIGAAGTAAELWGWITGSYPAFNRDKARELRHACTACSSEKAKHEFGYDPEIPLAEGVSETVQWYEQEGWL